MTQDKPEAVENRVLRGPVRRHLKRDPMEEIHRCRVEGIARLLVESDMSAGEIASAAEFEAEM
jgi:transcriptional regulator GlxA family with amidase domain